MLNLFEGSISKILFGPMMSFISGLNWGGDKGGETKAVMPSIYTMPQYDFTEPRLRATSNFIQGNIERLSRGEYPDYYANALPTLRENMHRPNYETYYGKAGEPGVLRSQMDVGSITGIGPRKTSKLVSKSLYEYGNAEKSIDEYLTKLGVDIMNKDAYTFPQLSSAMPKGPDAQLAYPQMVGGQKTDASGLGSAIGSLASGLLPGLGQSLSGMAGLFGGGGSAGSSLSSQMSLGGVGDLFSGGNGYDSPYQSIIGNQSSPFANYGYQQPTSAQFDGVGSSFGLFK